MEGTTLRLPNVGGFTVVKSPVKAKEGKTGLSLVAFVAKPLPSVDYTVGEATKLNGICRYHILQAAGVVRGLLIASPFIHTVVTPVMLKIGTCPGPFSINYNLQQLGILLYESPDSSLLIIPTDVKSPLLVEVDT
jgi:hypothetical protein